MMRTIINWANIHVTSKTREGTLAEVNCDLLPVASKIEDAELASAVKSAMNTLSAIYKNAVRYGQAQTVNDAQTYYSKIESASMAFVEMCGFDRIEWLNIIMGAGLKWNKAKAAPVLISETTFKKNVLRCVMYAQREARWNINEVKAEKAKKEKVTKSKSKPIINYAAIAEKLGVSVSAVMEAMDAESKAQAC